MRQFRRSFARVILLLVAVLAFRSTAPAQTGNQTQPQAAPSGPGGQGQYKADLVPPQSGGGEPSDRIEPSEASFGSAPAITASLPAITPAGR